MLIILDSFGVEIERIEDNRFGKVSEVPLDQDYYSISEPRLELIKEQEVVDDHQNLGYGS